MKRRNFIKSSLVGIISAFSMGAVAKVAVAVTAPIVWMKTGLLGYKSKATPDKVVGGKLCINCKWYKDDAKHEYGGNCTLKAVTSGMKSENVYVHSAGNCNMWAKK